MDRHLRAGIALFNVGQYADADAVWGRAAPTDAADEHLLAGLERLAATAGWAEEAAAAAAREHLAAVPDGHRGIDVAGARSLADGVRDGAVLRHRGVVPEPGTLAFGDVAAAARAIAADDPDYDPDVIEDAIGYAETAIADNDTNRFVTFVFDFVGEPAARGTVHRRLAEHVDRRRRRADDVEGLF